MPFMPSDAERFFTGGISFKNIVALEPIILNLVDMRMDTPNAAKMLLLLQSNNDYQGIASIQEEINLQRISSSLNLGVFGVKEKLSKISEATIDSEQVLLYGISCLRRSEYNEMILSPTIRRDFLAWV